MIQGLITLTRPEALILLDNWPILLIINIELQKKKKKKKNYKLLKNRFKNIEYI
jgi:hypothetical protein